MSTPPDPNPDTQPQLFTLMDVAMANTTPVRHLWWGVGDRPDFGIQLITSGTLSGTWRLEAANAPTFADDPSTPASDVTAAYVTPSGGAIAAAAGTPTSQFVQAPVAVIAAGFRATFSPTSGAGSARVRIALGRRWLRGERQTGPRGT